MQFAPYPSDTSGHFALYSRKTNAVPTTPPSVQVATLILEVQRVHTRLATLSDFNYRMSEEDIRLSWKTMDYPAVRHQLL